jgi:hypothetical protein
MRFQSGQVEMRSVINAWIADVKVYRKETMSCQATMAACLDSKELNPEDMGCEVEHLEVSTEEAVVKSSGTMKKRKRGRHQRAGRRGEPKEQTRVDSGSLRRSAATCRKVSRLHENLDPGTLCTAEGIGRSRQEDDPQYESGTVQGTRSQEIRPGQCGIRNPERTDVREETLEWPEI